MANWFDQRETRPAYRSYPNGRDWRCSGRQPRGTAHEFPLEPRPPAPCGFSEPEDARPTKTTCPDCGGQLVRTVADFNVVQERVS